MHATRLLNLLRDSYTPFLPKDAHTLLDVKHNYVIEDIAGGKYHHLGILEGVKEQMDKYPQLQELSSLSLQINVDGNVNVYI